MATFYHIMFDEVRDALQATTGFGWLAENWQMLVLTLLGILLLWNAKWKNNWKTNGKSHDAAGNLNA